MLGALLLLFFYGMVAGRRYKRIISYCAIEIGAVKHDGAG